MVYCSVAVAVEVENGLEIANAGENTVASRGSARSNAFRSQETESAGSAGGWIACVVQVITDCIIRLCGCLVQTVHQGADGCSRIRISRKVGKLGIRTVVPEKPGACSVVKENLGGRFHHDDRVFFAVVRVRPDVLPGIAPCLKS